MKIHFEPKDFLRKFKIAASIISAKEKPILQNVRIIADKRQGAILMATDTVVGIRIRVDCDVTEEGTVIVPIKQFRQILDLEKSEDWNSVTLSTTSDNKIRIESEETDCLLDAVESDEFHVLAQFAAESYHETYVEDLYTAIKRTIVAVKKDTPSVLGGVCFESGQDKNQRETIQLIASDEYRLAVQSFGSVQSGDHSLGSSIDKRPEHQTIVPVKCLKLLDKVFKEKSLDCEGRAVRLAVSRQEDTGQIMFHGEDVTVFSYLIKGRYPKWRGYVPEWREDESLQISVASGSLLTAIKRVEAVSTGSIVFRFDTDQLTLEGQGKEIGSTKTVIPAECKGKATLMLNPAHLTSMLKTLDSDSMLTFVLNGSVPIGMTADNHSYQYFVMPVSNADIPYQVEVNGIDIGKMIEQRKAEELVAMVEVVKTGSDNPAEESEADEPPTDESEDDDTEYEDELDEEEPEYEDEESNEDDEPIEDKPENEAIDEESDEESENEDSDDIEESEDEPVVDAVEKTVSHIQINTWAKKGVPQASTPATTSVSHSQAVPAKQKPPKDNEAVLSKRKQFAFME